MITNKTKQPKQNNLVEPRCLKIVDNYLNSKAIGNYLQGDYKK